MIYLFPLLLLDEDDLYLGEEEVRAVGARVHGTVRDLDDALVLLGEQGPLDGRRAARRRAIGHDPDPVVLAVLGLEDGVRACARAVVRVRTR